MPLRQLNQRVYHETDVDTAPDWRNKAWSEVFRVTVEGGKPIPEEPCRKCVRIYGIFTSELSSARDSIDDKWADAGYASADVQQASDTIRLLADDGCIGKGFVRDAEHL